MCQSPVIKICRVGETLKVIQVKLLSEQEVFSICFVPLKFGSSLKESKMDLFEPSCCSLKTWRATKLGAKWTHAICLAGKGVKPAYSTSIINSKMYSSILCSSMFFLYDGLLYLETLVAYFFAFFKKAKKKPFPLKSAAAKKLDERNATGETKTPFSTPG